MSSSRDPDQQRSKDPLHGITLEAIVKALVERHGWEELGTLIDIRCFSARPERGLEPQVSAPHALGRKKVEDLYVFGRRHNS